MQNYLIVPDLHISFSDPKFLSLILKIVKAINPTGIVQLGDALDFWQISRYDKNPARKNEILDDIREWSKVLDQWEVALSKGSEIILLEGNHCDRLRRYIWSNAKELHNIIPSIPEMLGLKGRNKAGKIKYTWHNIAKWDSCRIGDCILHHGFYYGNHLAVTNLIKYPLSFIQGHSHRFQYVTDGKKFSVSLGHGSDESYTSHNPVPSNWQQALGILYVENGKTSFEPLLVKNGETILYGKKIKA